GMFAATDMVDGARGEVVAPAAAEPAVAGRAHSRHTDAQAGRFAVRGENLNPWCRVPGSPFADGLLLLPNHPSAPSPTVWFGPVAAGGVSALTALLVSPEEPRHGNRLAAGVSVRAASDDVVAERTVVLGPGERAAVSLRFSPQDADGLRVAIDVSFAHFD